MDYRLSYNEQYNCVTFNNKPVQITENETSYLFKDTDTNEIVYFLEYSYLLRISNGDQSNSMYVDIIRIALLSDGLKYVPTILLLPNKDQFVHNKIPLSLTSLKKFSSWLKLISLNIHGVFDVENCNFQPYEKLQIAEIFKSLNFTGEDPDDLKKCLEDSQEMFDFKHNLIKVSWFDRAINKYGSTLPLIEDEHAAFTIVDPRFAFLQLNNIMRQICVWEASNFNIESVIASNIVFIYFLQDTNSSTNNYTPLLPILQALLVYNTSPARPITNSVLDRRASIIFDKARFNRERHSGLYAFQMKMKGLKDKCNRTDCVELIQQYVFHCTFFNDMEELCSYIRKALNIFNKPEMYIYVFFFGSILAGLRRAKRQKNITGTHNLSNFNFSNVYAKSRILPNQKEVLIQNIRQDMSAIFDFVDVYIDYMQNIKTTDQKINDEILFYFMKSNDSISTFVNYLLKTILPLVTSQLV